MWGWKLEFFLKKNFSLKEESWQFKKKEVKAFLKNPNKNNKCFVRARRHTRSYQCLHKCIGRWKKFAFFQQTQRGASWSGTRIWSSSVSSISKPTLPLESYPLESKWSLIWRHRRKDSLVVHTSGLIQDFLLLRSEPVFSEKFLIGGPQMS